MFGCDPCNRDSGDGRACLQCNAIFERQITLDEHILRTHPNSIASVTSKIHQCTRCAFKTTVSGCFKEHLSKHPETSSNKFSTCTHCDATFKRKSSLDNHLIKQHPNFISSVTNKIHKCTKCSYETTISSHLKSHLSKHSETPAICAFCHAPFKSRTSLDDHILKKHPTFIASVTSKIHECGKCTFKTAFKNDLNRHSLKHLDRPITCTHCKASFNKKISLDDHIIKYHPNFASSVTSKIHKCTKCNFETTMCTDLKRHSMKHAETPDKHMLSTCRFCQAMFKSKTSVDDHILRKHPTFIASVTSKIHECAKCTFKTVYTNNLKIHSLRHLQDSRACLQCNTIFKRQITLDEHILRRHPNYISCVTSKIHECTLCAFKTTLSGRFKKHLLKHSEPSSDCTHCDRTFKTKSLLDNHLIKKHPNFVSSVTNKIHKCTMCSYETTISTNLRSHLLIHAKTPAICRFCQATFKSKTSVDDHILRKHPNFIASVTSKIHECAKCTFKTVYANNLKIHSFSKSRDGRACLQCNAIFKRQTTLDEHILRTHPNSISSVTSKLHECTQCAFKTTARGRLKKHLLKHSETSSDCALCHASFKTKRTLDNHTLQKHPKFIDSVTSKIHECTLCTFKTTMNAGFKEHLLKHPETISSYKFSACTHCDQTFKRKYLLDNHVLKKHPNVISSAINKIYKCTECNYETTISASLRRHMKVHSKTLPNLTCVQCNTTFKRKIFLDDHIVKKHPDFMESVTSRIHECRKCTFKTAFRNDLNRHSLNHLETAPSL
nr:unnamed protein product [Callosobruchus analis]